MVETDEGKKLDETKPESNANPEDEPQPNIPSNDTLNHEDQSNSNLIPRSLKKKISDILAEVGLYYYALIPAAFAIMILSIVDSFKKIPGLNSSLFDPGFVIGMQFVILSTVVGAYLLYLSERKFKKLRKDIDKIHSDLYVKKSISIQKSTKHKDSNSSFDEVLENLIKKIKTIKPKSWAYVIIAIGIVFAIGIIGNTLADDIAPPFLTYHYDSIFDPNIHLNNFQVVINAENYDNKKNSIIRTTERIKHDFVITSRYPENATLRYTEKILNVDNSVRIDIKSYNIPKNGILNFTRYLPLEKPGMNSVSFKLEFDKPITSHAGIQNPNAWFIDSGEINLQYRVYTQSEYDYKIERSELYRWIWLAGFPLVLVGIKAFRDILEDKGN